MTSLAFKGTGSFTSEIVSFDQIKTSRGGKSHKNKVLMMLILVFALLFGSVVSFGSTQKAEANWFTDGLKNTFCAQRTYFNEPQAWQNGLTSLGIGVTSGGMMSVQGFNPVQQGSNLLANLSSGDKNFLNSRHTAYQKYGMSGTTWSVYAGEKAFVNEKERAAKGNKENDKRVSAYESTCVPIMPIIGTYFANSIFSFTKFFTSVSGWILTQAYEPTWLHTLSENVSDVITGKNGNKGLRDTLYFPFLGLVIFFASLYLFWVGLVKKRSVEAGTSALWMVGAVVVGSLFMYNPSVLPDAATDLTTEVSSALLVGTAGNANGAQDSSKTGVNICYNPEGAKANNITKKRDFIITNANCVLWQTFVYNPWAVGQFGVSSSALDSDGKTGLNGNAVTIPPQVNLGGNTNVRNWGLYQLEQQSIDIYALSQGNDAINDKIMNWYKVPDAVGSPDGDQKLFDAWSGNDPSSRIMIALASLIAGVAGMMIIFVLSMSMLAYSIGTVILTFVAVIFLLLGAHPGMGRRLALRWSEMYVSTIMKKIFIAAMLGMVLAFYSTLLSNPSDNWGSMIIAIIALSIATLMYRKDILNAVGDVNFGGSGFDSRGAEQAKQVVKGVGTGAALGAVAGIAGGAKAAGLAMQTGQGGAMRRVGSAAVKGSSQVVKGAARGARHGAVNAGGFGRYAGMNAGSVAAAGGRRDLAKAQGKLDAKQEAQQAALERAQEERVEQERLQSPDRYATQQAEQQRAHERYTKDWEKHHNDEGWNSRFQRTYGFAAPNPYTHRFAGYGKRASELSPDLMPRPIEKPKDEPQDQKVDDKRPSDGGPKAPPPVAPTRTSVMATPPSGAPKPSDAPVTSSRPMPRPTEDKGTSSGKPSGGSSQAMPKPTTGNGNGGSGSGVKPKPQPPASGPRPSGLQEQRLQQAEEAELRARRARNQGGSGGGMPRPGSR